jgi:hypothetical protein
MMMIMKILKMNYARTCSKEVFDILQVNDTQ